MAEEWGGRLSCLLQYEDQWRLSVMYPRQTQVGHWQFSVTDVSTADTPELRRADDGHYNRARAGPALRIARLLGLGGGAGRGRGGGGGRREAGGWGGWGGRGGAFTSITLTRFQSQF